MLFDKDLVARLSAGSGNAFYVLDIEQFEKNYKELKHAFASVYPRFDIAYSYKTNYTPTIIKTVNSLGGFAEVVSDLELELAKRVGVKPNKIIFNGPYKNTAAAEALLIAGGIVNIDSVWELDYIRELAVAHRDKQLRVGLRCNFDINDGVTSRFGFDVDDLDFLKALELINSESNLVLECMQCHFAVRSLDTWRSRTLKMLALIKKHGLTPGYIDLGGGLYGKMPDSLKRQFSDDIPHYGEYASVVATLVAEQYSDVPYKDKPVLLVEPGSALVGDCMKFISRVVNIKNVRGKAIATLLGSVYNINPTLNKKNPPLEIVPMGGERERYTDLDFGGYTCIESDYLYRHYDGELAVGDFAVFGNVGSYSVVLKPPFILPNFPVLLIDGDKVQVVKNGETFDDIFHTYAF